MFVTLSEYKKRCDAVLKIAQIISKAYDKDRFKNLIKDKINNSVDDNILKILNNYRKEHDNLPPLTKDNLKDIILRNINWKSFWCDINGLKTTLQNHQSYCLKNTYSEVLETAEDFGYRGDYFEKDKLEKEKRSNPKEYYSKNRGELIEDAVQWLNLYTYDIPKVLYNFVVDFSTGGYGLDSDNFNKEIYGVKFYKDNHESEIKVEKKFLSKKYYPPNFYQLIIADTFENEIFDKIYEGFKKMEEYGVVLAGSKVKYSDIDWGDNYQLQLIDWVADSRYKM